MNFATPTTKEQMYSTLQQIFNYYRVQYGEFEQANLQPLELERMEFTPLSDEQLAIKAEKMLSAEKEEYYFNQTLDYSSKIAAIREKIDNLEQERQDRLDEMNSHYANAINEVKTDAVKKGIANSTIVSQTIAKLSSEQAEKIQKINQEFDGKNTIYQDNLYDLQNYMSDLSSYINNLYTLKKNILVNQLKDEQTELMREIFKYNNGLSEKEQRYANHITQSNANLQLKYMEIRSAGFTKDELIEMGYYEDVINCVTGYYNTLSAVTAYREILDDTKVKLYLDDYYEEVVYVYALRIE